MTGNCLVPFYKQRPLNHAKQLLYNRYRQFEFTPLRHRVLLRWAAPPSSASEFVMKDSSGCSGLVVSVVIEST